MRHGVFFLIVSSMLLACSPKVVYKPTPKQVITLPQAVQLVGTVQPWGLDFTAVAARHEDGVRLLVLSAVGIKLLDLGVWPTRAEIYFRQEKFPSVAVEAFVRFARSTFKTDCVAEEILYRDVSRAIFEGQIIGENKCL